MKLCFDATSFGSGLDGAVELASARKLKAVEYSFAPFAPAKANKKADDKEQDYLKSVRQLADEKEVEFACLNLNFCLDASDKKSVKQFLPMIEKLGQVAAAVGAKKVAFHLRPHAEDDWIEPFAAIYPTLRDSLGALGVAPLISLSTPHDYRGLSLKKWRALDPQEWRDLLSNCAGLALVYSPADCLWLGIDYLANLAAFATAIDHVVAHDIEINRTILTDSGMYGPLWWRYRLAGKGLVDWRQLVEALKLYGFMGTLSMQFEDEFLPADDPLALEDAMTESVRHFQRLLRG
jgi:sugar phosphate isomerase/epimerase